MSGPADEAAFQLDAYLEDLLAGRGRSLAQAESAPDVEPELAAAAAAMVDALPRFHPSFRFEEQLAARLRAAAGSRRGRAGAPVALFTGEAEPQALVLPGWVRRPTWASERALMLVGGAIASGVSIAGAALLAWRRARADDNWEGLA